MSCLEHRSSRTTSTRCLTAVPITTIAIAAPCTTLLKLHLKRIDYNSISGGFSNFRISQGSVATQWRLGGRICRSYTVSEDLRPRCVSLMHANCDGWYVRHSSSEVRVDPESSAPDRPFFTAWVFAGYDRPTLKWDTMSTRLTKGSFFCHAASNDIMTDFSF